MDASALALLDRQHHLRPRQTPRRGDAGLERRVALPHNPERGTAAIFDAPAFGSLNPWRLTVGVCRVHALRNLLAVATAQHRQVIAALIRTIFAQPDAASARTQLRSVVDQLQPIAPAVADRLEAAETDLLAYTTFPPAHWPRIWSNNPIERLNREIKRRTDVVQIFPNPESVIRLVGALLVETNDEMLAADRRYIAQASLAELTDPDTEITSLPAAPRT